jgi:hypothetical protein
MIEVDGMQHFERVPFFHRKPGSFAARRRSDRQKTRDAIAVPGRRIIRIAYTFFDKDPLFQLAWLEAALRTPHPFLVYDLELYGWMSDLDPRAIPDPIVYVHEGRDHSPPPAPPAPSSRRRLCASASILGK